MEARIRPKSDYLHQASWEELYVLTNHWRSDLDFYSDELKFLMNLIDRYSIWLTNDDNIRRVEKVKLRVAVIRDFKEDLLHGILKHMSHIKEMIVNPFCHDEMEFRNEHAELEEDFTDFFKAHRAIKKEVFSLTGIIMETEEVNGLLH